MKKTEHMQGKTVQITGATDGNGEETDRQLAGMGTRVLIHGRKRDKAERVKKEIIQTTGNEQVDTVIANLQVMENV